MNFIKIKKNFCSAKDLVKRMKRQTTDWNKTLANYISDTGLMARTLKSDSKNQMIQVENRQRHEKIFHPRGHIDNKKVPETMFNIISQYRNAN